MRKREICVKPRIIILKDVCSICHIPATHTKGGRDFGHTKDKHVSGFSRDLTEKDIRDFSWLQKLWRGLLRQSNNASFSEDVETMPISYSLVNHEKMHCSLKVEVCELNVFLFRKGKKIPPKISI